MADKQQQIDQLLQRLNMLSDKQAMFQQEVAQLRRELNTLRAAQAADKTAEAAEPPPPPMQEKTHAWHPAPAARPATDSARPAIRPDSAQPAFALSADFKANLEKFIGENLINKIGIAITVLGVGIGAKYSIENQLISPLTRIVLGYLMGIALLAFALRLKPKYENLSAVLLSGAMAIMYFITYAAYSFYGLLPQPLSFGLMLLFTAFTVLAAIHYNQQLIAHIGLVGAYAVPFLLSQGEGRVDILFSYMAIINGGILLIAYQRYWRPLYHVSFGLSWLIYLAWYATSYQWGEHFALAFGFLAVFFVLFYLTFLSYKLFRREQFVLQDVVLLLANSFLFYGIGYALLEGHPQGEQLTGLFTLANAGIHFGISFLIYKNKLAEKNLFYLLAGLVLVFVTIAIPVQLDGNWVTLLWTGLALLLFVLGRKRQLALYEVLSYPLMALAFLSLLDDWQEGYPYYTPDPMVPLFNSYFLTSFLFVAAFAGMFYLHRKTAYLSEMKMREKLLPFINYLLPVLLLVAGYYSLRLEIAGYWNQLYWDSAVKIRSEDIEGETTTIYDYSLRNVKTLWILMYSMAFLTLLALGNGWKGRSRQLGMATLVLDLLCIATFLGIGLLSLSELRESYLNQVQAEYYHRGVFYLLIRYLSLAFLGSLLFSVYRLMKQSFMQLKGALAFDFLLHLSVLWVLSSELFHWMSIGGVQQSHKLGLSILWGIYALFLIALGIGRKKKHLRLGAIGLFAITLLKLFFYDIAELDTIAKTVVFVSLGTLLLLVSFLYNKYKHLIADEAPV
jgi:uncharacterized membrane protein